MSPTMSLAETRLITETRIVLDRLLTPMWPAVGAVASSRDVSADGIRYNLTLPRLDLRLDAQLARADAPMVLLRLSARRRDLLGRAAGTVTHPLDSGFDDVALRLITDASAGAVDSALLELRAVLWDHSSCGPNAMGIRPAA